MLLLRVWQVLAARLGENTPELVLIGRRGWMFDEVVYTLERDEVARRHVREIGGCSDHELRDLLLGSRALLMPSVAEGFGLPVAEALGCGVPVIASELPVYREFAGDVPDYLAADDVPAWVAMVEAYCGPGSTARLSQLARLEGWQPPLWSSHFAAVEALLRQLGEKAGAP
jgi:glycosyltransferase involved in cell wall biosynthesis